MIKIKSPGRICLFGEHQDYLSFPVISMAITKYIYLEAKKVVEKKFLIELSDIGQTLEINLNNKEQEYNTNRDYLRSGYNQFLRRGIKFENGYKIIISGDIPINAGVASSSALVIAWLYFLNLISNQKCDLKQLALMGFHSEVIEFNEGGGMMDHYTAAYGNLLHLTPSLPNPNLINYDLMLKGFVLGDLLEKKSTVEDLIKVKESSLISIKYLKKLMPNFDQFNTKLEDVEPYLPSLSSEYQKKLRGILINRDITNRAKNLIDNNFSLIKSKKWSKEIEYSYKKLGNLLNQHQEQLKTNIGISTSKIDKILSKCNELGAYGGKINGSGFGGTMFALYPGNQEKLINAIKEGNGKPYIIETSRGVEVY